MDGGAVGYNFEMGLPKDYPSQICLNLVQRFQKRRFKCESLRRTTDGQRRMPSDGKSSHGLWPGELKTYSVHISESKMIHNARKKPN